MEFWKEVRQLVLTGQMSQRLDVQKQRQWEERFCAEERVSPHTLYYWARRVGSQRTKTSRL